MTTIAGKPLKRNRETLKVFDGTMAAVVWRDRMSDHIASANQGWRELLEFAKAHGSEILPAQRMQWRPDSHSRWDLPCLLYTFVCSFLGEKLHWITVICAGNTEGMASNSGAGCSSTTRVAVSSWMMQADGVLQHVAAATRDGYLEAILDRWYEL